MLIYEGSELAAELQAWTYNVVGWRLWLNQPTFDVGRISGEATPSDNNDEFTRNNPTYRVNVKYKKIQQYLLLLANKLTHS